MDLLYFTIALIIYYSLHSLFADEMVKDKLQKKIIPKRGYRIFYNLLSIVLIIPTFWLYSQIEQQLILTPQTWLRWTGWIIFGAGVLLLILAMRQYNLREFVGTFYLNTTNKNHIKLNIKGLNSYVRHPLYTASLMILWAWLMITPNSAALTLALISSIYLYFGIRLEERKLIRQFGEDYIHYRKKTPMLFPYKRVRNS